MVFFAYIVSVLGHLISVVLIAWQFFFGFFTPPVAVSVPPVPTSTKTIPTATTSPKVGVTIAPIKVPVTAPPTTTIPTIPAPVTPPPTVAPSPPALPQDQVNTAGRSALVNILCTTRVGGAFNPISGSGVIVAGNGVILTNAHVGQFFLLRDYPVPDNVDCLVRTGSPATPKYHAQLLYLPPLWIDANASQIAAQEGLGTGENDYSFLYITSTTDGSPLPKSFPAIPMTTDAPVRGDGVLLAAYPAGFLDGQTIQMNLFITSAFTTINDIFAFDTSGTADLISIRGTIVSQAGSSGGGVVRSQDGALLGIIATDTEGTTTDSRDLRAITIAHINRSLGVEGKGGIVQLLSGDLAQKTADFGSTVAPGLEQKLIDALKP